MGSREWAPVANDGTGHIGSVNTVAITPDGKYIVSGGGRITDSYLKKHEDCILRVWEIESGRLLRSMEGHVEKITAVAFTPDGRQAISSAGNTTNVWELESGRLLHSIKGHFENHVTAVAINPNGTQVVSGLEDETLNVWGLEIESKVVKLENHIWGERDLAISPDGQKVLSSTQRFNLKVWDLESGQLLRTLDVPVSPKNAAITPDGRLSAGWSDKTLEVWDLETGRLAHELENRHTQFVNTIGITPDGKYVITGSDDQTIRLWNIPDNKSTILFWNDTVIRCLTLSQDGSYLCCGDLTGRVWIFEWSKGEYLPSSKSTLETKIGLMQPTN